MASDLLTSAETFEARLWVDREQLHRDRKERSLLVLAYLAGLKRAGLFGLLLYVISSATAADLTNAAYRVLTNTVSQANDGRAVSSFYLFRANGSKVELATRADVLPELKLGGTVTVLAKTPALLRALPFNPSSVQVFHVIRSNHAAFHAARAP